MATKLVELQTKKRTKTTQKKSALEGTKSESLYAHTLCIVIDYMYCRRMRANTSTGKFVFFTTNTVHFPVFQEKCCNFNQKNRCYEPHPQIRFVRYSFSVVNSQESKTSEKSALSKLIFCIQKYFS